MIRQYQTINTFTRRPVPAQIITYLVFIGEALTFFICMYVNYSHIAKKISIITLYIVTMIIQIILTLITSCVDPSDDVMIEYRNNPEGRRNMNVDNCLYCDICTSYVKQTSRHCKVCQRCVQKFDHHCMWINNCIGEKNYYQFMAMTVVTLVNLAVYIIGMVLLWTENQWELYLGSMVTVWAYSFLVGLFAILLINLIGLHFYLISKGITTYQFIIMQREQQAKKKEQQEQQRTRHHLSSSNVPVAVIQGSQHQTNAISNQRVQHHSGSHQRIVSVGVAINANPSANHTSTKHENTNEVIFGMSANQNEIENNRTQKSEEMNEQNGQIGNKSKRNIGDYLNQNDDLSSMGLRAQNQENISNYFTKNKSLKFFIGDQIGSRPKSTKNAQMVSRDKLFRSARAVQMQAKKQVLHYSQNKYRQKSTSLQIKPQKQPHQIQVLQYQQKQQTHK